jgi:beta-glucosidase
MKTTVNVLAILFLSALVPGTIRAEQTNSATVSGAVSATTPRAATPAPKGKEGWREQHDQLVAQARKGKIDLLFVGDSRTKCWSREGRDVWTNHFEKLHAANFGISGDCTQNVLWRLQNGELDPVQPKALVLLIGTNNITEGDKPEDIAQAVRAILQEIRRRSPGTRILLLGILPRRELANHRDRETIRAINSLLSRLRDGDHVTYLDFGDKLLQPDGGLTTEVTKDFCHLTAKGYEIFAEAIQPVVESLLRTTP